MIKKICNSCGENTHQRITSKLCKNYKKKKKEIDCKDNMEIQKYCYKTGFFRFCRKNKELYDKINLISCEVTKMLIESSRFLQLHFTRQFYNNEELTILDQTTLDHIFKTFSSGNEEILKEDTLKNSFKIYMDTRPVDLPWAKVEIPHIIESMRVEYITNCKNHINTNIDKWTVKWIRHELEEIIEWEKMTSYQQWKLIWSIYNYANNNENIEYVYPFDEYNVKQKCIQELKTGKRIGKTCDMNCKIDKDITYNLCSRHLNSKENKEHKELHIIKKIVTDYFCEETNNTVERIIKFLKRNLSGNKISWLFFLNIHFSVTKQRIHTLVPIYTYHRKYFNIDTRTFCCLCKDLFDNFPKEQELMDDEELKKYWWSKVFKIKNINKFDFSIKTDGVGVSVLLYRYIHKKEKDEKGKIIIQTDSKLDFISDEIIDLIYDDNVLITFVDPGRKNLSTSISRMTYTLESIEDEKPDIKYDTNIWTSKKFHHHKGNTQHAKLTIKKLKKNGLYDSLLKTPTLKSPMLDDIKKSIKYFHNYIEDIFEIYFKHKITYYKWKTYIREQKAYDKITDELTGGNKNSIVVFGAGSFSSTSKGHISGPVKKLRKHLKKKCNFVDENEYFTSQRCSKCLHFLKKQKKEDSHFFQECSNILCGKKWNRDINSARNIMLVFLNLLFKCERPFEFTAESKPRNENQLTHS